MTGALECRSEAVASLVIGLSIILPQQWCESSEDEGKAMPVLQPPTQSYCSGL